MSERQYLISKATERRDYGKLTNSASRGIVSDDKYNEAARVGQATSAATLAGSGALFGSALNSGTLYMNAKKGWKVVPKRVALPVGAAVGAASGYALGRRRFSNPETRARIENAIEARRDRLNGLAG